MARIRRLIPSPAMAVALVALFMAMGGSAYALVVTSGSIKNNTIRSVDVRNGGLSGKDIRARRPRRPRGQGVDARHGAERASSRRQRALRRRERRRAAGPRPRNHVGGANGRGSLPGDLRPRRARLRVLRDDGGPSAAAPPDNGADQRQPLGSNVNGVDVRTENGGTARTPTSRSTYSSSAEPPPSGRILDAPEHLRGCSGRDRERRDVLRHDAVRPDHAALARSRRS